MLKFSAADGDVNLIKDLEFPCPPRYTYIFYQKAITNMFFFYYRVGLGLRAKDILASLHVFKAITFSF